MKQMNFALIVFVLVFSSNSSGETRANGGASLVNEMSEALTICWLESVSDGVSLKNKVQGKQIEYMKSSGAGSVPSEKMAEFYSDSLKEFGDGSLPSCQRKAKEKYTKNPARTVSLFGKRHRDQVKRFLVLWESALDAIGTEKEADLKSLFDMQKTSLGLDLKVD